MNDERQPAGGRVDRRPTTRKTARPTVPPPQRPWPPLWSGYLGAFLLGLFVGIGATVLAVYPRGGDTGPVRRSAVGPGAAVPTGPSVPEGTDNGQRPKDPPPTLPPGDSIEAKVARVVDGDTIHVSHQGQTLKIRYLGVNTPESLDNPGYYKGIEFYGKEAAERNRQLTEGKTVRLEFDRERLDKYNRMLAYVWVGDVLVNRKLLEEGCAEVYRRAPNIRYFQEFLLLEQEAKKKGLGMWNEAAKAQWKAPPRRKK